VNILAAREAGPGPRLKPALDLKLSLAKGKMGRTASDRAGQMSIDDGRVTICEKTVVLTVL
jgi:hypothetical protein